MNDNSVRCTIYMWRFQKLQNSGMRIRTNLRLRSKHRKPKPRRLAQHSGPPGWLEESGPAGCNFVCEWRTILFAPVCEAAQLRASGKPAAAAAGQLLNVHKQPTRWKSHMVCRIISLVTHTASLDLNLDFWSGACGSKRVPDPKFLSWKKSTMENTGKGFTIVIIFLAQIQIYYSTGSDPELSILNLSFKQSGFVSGKYATLGCSNFFYVNILSTICYQRHQREKKQTGTFSSIHT
jgi:hypothetical protein